jgi:hypothetical protein
VALVAQVISLLAVQAPVAQTPMVQVAVAVDISQQVLTHLEQALETVETVVAVAVAAPTMAQAVTAVMAYFISTTKRGKQWQHMQ